MWNYNYELCHHGILGQKWGVRRYQDKDGNLTEAGMKRYRKDLSSISNKELKKLTEDVIKAKYQNPDKWVGEDLNNIKNVLDSGKQLLTLTKDLDSSVPKQKIKPLDLSNISDAELRERINREMLERQYNDMFNSKNYQKTGKDYINGVLKVAIPTVGLASGLVGLALQIRKLKGID